MLLGFYVIPGFQAPTSEVCGIETKSTPIVVVGQQWSFISHSNNIYQALATQTILVDIKNNIE